MTVERVAPRPSSDPTPATVTVVIPCFDYADYLPGAVRSALNQVGVEVDVIVVDDASTDGSLAVARGFADDDTRVQVLAHDHNSGPVETFNDGLAQAKGEFLVRLDADDRLTPGSLERAVAVARAYPTVGLIYGHPLHVVDESFPEARSVPTGWTVWPGLVWLADRCRNGLNVITSPEVVMRRSVVDVVGGQKPLAHTHDMEMWLRIAAFSDVAYIHGVDQAWHRDHPRSLSAREVDPLRDLRERVDAFDTLFSGVASSVPDAAALHIMARTAVASDSIARAEGLFDTRVVNRELLTEYLELSASLVDHPTALRHWKTVQRRAARPTGSAIRPAYLFDRLARRLRSERSWRRWHRSGVF
ncbi:MAG: glycosyltransferase family 2 protein [Rhodococcus sp. (in: high G+C Gram-positive bacteria)]